VFLFERGLLGPFVLEFLTTFKARIQGKRFPKDAANQHVPQVSVAVSAGLRGYQHPTRHTANP
jgi:hypothetical protein